jgi:phytoene dehydrogenase-like protein
VDAVVVGSGPNGLAAAIALARAGLSVSLLERADMVGGGMRSAELTLPGFVHDVCSAIHPLAAVSPFLTSLPLEEHGLEWVRPAAALAHPFDDGTAAVLERSIAATGETLGDDAPRWARLFGPLARTRTADGRPVRPPRPPRHPLALARFGAAAALPASSLARLAFRGERARALFAGLAAHSLLPLSRAPSAAFGLVLGLLGHATGWPFPRGGSQRLADALASYLRSLGGTIETGREVRSLAELDGARLVLLDVAPRGLLALAGGRPRRAPPPARAVPLRPGCSSSTGARRPDPWRAEARAQRPAPRRRARRDRRLRARAVARPIAARPFMILAQPSLFDSRAPAGRAPPGPTATSRTGRRWT